MCSRWRLETKRQQLKEILSDSNIYGKFGVVIKIENEEIPAMYLEKELIKFMHDIGAEIDFDMYINS